MYERPYGMHITRVVASMRHFLDERETGIKERFSNGVKRSTFPSFRLTDINVSVREISSNLSFSGKNIITLRLDLVRFVALGAGTITDCNSSKKSQPPIRSACTRFDGNKIT